MPAGRKPKFDVNFSERFEVRLTAEQKELIKFALDAGYTAGTASVARELLLRAASDILAVDAGRITADDAAKNYAVFIARMVDSKDLIPPTPEEKPDDASDEKPA